MRMGTERLPRKAYIMLVNIHNSEKQCWLSAIRVRLMMDGFGCIWINQGVQDINWFTRVFRERISDCWKQGWDERVHERDRYAVYRMFKLEQSLEPCIHCVANKAQRDVFVRFRLGISDSKTHKLRCSGDPDDDLSYPLCECSLDDQIYFLFLYKATDTLGSKFLPQIYLQD